MLSGGKMTDFIPNQAIIVIVGLNHTLQVFWAKPGAETPSRRRPPALRCNKSSGNETWLTCTAAPGANFLDSCLVAHMFSLWTTWAASG